MRTSKGHGVEILIAPTQDELAEGVSVEFANEVYEFLEPEVSDGSIGHPRCTRVKSVQLFRRQAMVIFETATRDAAGANVVSDWEMTFFKSPSVAVRVLVVTKDGMVVLVREFRLRQKREITSVIYGG